MQPAKGYKPSWNIAIPNGIERSERKTPLPGSGLERIATSARLGCVRVVDGEAVSTLEAVVIVDDGSLEVKTALLVDYDADPMAIELVVGGIIELAVKGQLIRESRATTTSHSQAEHGPLFELLHATLDFGGSFFGQDDDAHRFLK